VTLSAFVAFSLGVAVDVLRLVERNREGPYPQNSAVMRALAALPVLSLERWIIALLGAAAVLVIAALEVTGWGRQRATLDRVAVALPAGLMVAFALYYGLLSARLMPRVNEATILATNTAVVLGLVLHTGLDDRLILLGLALPTAGMLIAALRSRAPRPFVQALAYLWYLMGMLALTIQNGPLDLTNQSDLSLFEAFILGAALTLLFLHSFFLIRFFLMVSALILPRHHPYLAEAMPHLFESEQAPLWQILALEGLVIVPLLANARFDLAPSLTVINVLVLVVIQGPTLSQLRARLQRLPGRVNR
jgi:hypothetical protein